MTPRATYRLQLRPDLMTFRDAAAVVERLAELGVSHLYLSPVLASAPGSSHGYDVVDPTRLDGELGGEEGFSALVTACREHGLGIVLDVVPNHLGLVSPANRWWWDVLRVGPTSEHAHVFDIDWATSEHGVPYVLVPQLGRPLVDEVLDGDDLWVDHDGDQFVVRYHEHTWPVRPGSVAAAGLDEDQPAAVVAALAASRARLLALLHDQHHRLAHWRRASRELNMRRFFDITTLGGVRVEDEAVFDLTHERVLRLVDDGIVDGLRIDHPDGLDDPTGYVQRLRARAPDAWIVLEKILEPGEALREDWPVDGTVGYEFLNELVGICVDPTAEPAFDALHREAGGPGSWDALVATSKRHVLHTLFVPERDRLVTLATAVVGELDPAVDADVVECVVEELLVAYPVYRGYVHPGRGEVADRDRDDVAAAVATARAHLEGRGTRVLDLLAEVLVLDRRPPGGDRFVRRFQQLSGPVMAKGVEDTAFYRHQRLVALNEVGGAPQRFGLDPAAFHASAARRAAERPTTMLATSTHDTKRSEDVRARLVVLSEHPDRWARGVRGWERAGARFVGEHGPSRAHRLLALQTVVGAWPIDGDRLAAYLKKAAREGKQETDWHDPDEDYEADLERYARAVVEDPACREVVAGLVSLVGRAGDVTSLAWTLVKLTAPGVPDVYQGTELWDRSLVDPDNRRRVDHDLRRRLQDDLGPRPDVADVLARWGEGLPKLWVVREALHVRRERPEAFTTGGYQPLVARGDREEHVVAFVRGTEVVVVVPRLVGSLGAAPGWGDTRLLLPDGRWQDRFSRRALAGEVRLADLLSDFPVALLERDDA